MWRESCDIVTDLQTFARAQQERQENEYANKKMIETRSRREQHMLRSASYISGLLVVYGWTETGAHLRKIKWIT